MGIDAISLKLLSGHLQRMSEDLGKIAKTVVNMKSEDTFQCLSKIQTTKSADLKKSRSPIQRLGHGLGTIVRNCIVKPIRFLLEKIGLYPKTRATAYQAHIRKATEKFQKDWEKYTSGLSSVVDPHTLAKVRSDAMNNLQKLSKSLKREGITDHEVAMAAHDFQEAFLRQIQDFILAHGTEQEKAKILKLQAFQRNFETLGHAIPDHMETLALEDLPKSAQDHLRQMVLEMLRSDLPELTEWGRQQGRAIGMTEQQIQKVIDTKGSPPPAAAAATAQLKRKTGSMSASSVLKAVGEKPLGK